jgi:hypothetical protein
MPEARSDMMTFWKFLTDTKFTGSPSKLTEDDLRQMGRNAELFENEIEAVLRGYREFLEQKG